MTASGNIQSVTDQGDPKKPNEDWVHADEHLVVVLDGQTVRTDTGCVHGVPWYVEHLGRQLVNRAGAGKDLVDALASSIRHVAAEHPGCDLTHPGTPSAGLAVLRLGPTIEWLVLGDVTVVLDAAGKPQIIADHRVSATAPAERAEVARWPIGSPERAAALIAMKHAELAARNRPGGYWIAAADPAAATHGLTGNIPADQVRRAAVLTDGAARMVDLFGLLDWPKVLDLLDIEGPTGLVTQVRQAEAADQAAVRWPRTKQSDDASLVYVPGHRAPTDDSVVK